jgi:hypothetical protein
MEQVRRHVRIWGGVLRAKRFSERLQMSQKAMPRRKLGGTARHELCHWAASAVGGLGNLILARISSAWTLARAAGKKPSTIR